MEIALKESLRSKPYKKVSSPFPTHLPLVGAHLSSSVRPRGPPFLITALVLLAALYPPRPDTPAGRRDGIQIYGAPVFLLPDHLITCFILV